MRLSVSPSDAANVTQSSAYIVLICRPKVSIKYSLFPHTSVNP